MELSSIFNILGPVMIGPSSSHTAGACRLGRMAMRIAGPGFTRVLFELHGSFAETYRGHGTDRALAAGVLDMRESDERLRDALKIAAESGLDFVFVPADLGYVHENSVRMTFTYPDGHTAQITGSSLGGGEIEIIDIDGYSVSLAGKAATLIISESDQKGIIHDVSGLLSAHGINIGMMNVVRRRKHMEAVMMIEIDEPISETLITVLNCLPNIMSVRQILPL